MTEITYKELKDGRKYKLRPHRDRFFYPTEWLDFKKQIRPKNWYPFEFLINTGCRINEARNVKFSDFDFENKRLVIRITKVKSKKGEKNPRPRIIPVSPQFIKVIKKQQANLHKKAGDFVKIGTSSGVNKLLLRGVKRANIKDPELFSVHNIRKTFEMWLLALNVDSLKVTAHVGHSLGVAASNYISADVLSHKEKLLIRKILGDLYAENRRY